MRNSGDTLVANQQSPICRKCGLDDCKSKRPYVDFKGPTRPLISVIVDSIAKKEDETGDMAVEGSANGLLRKTIIDIAKEVGGIDVEKDIRWVATTRCANRTAEKVNYATKSNWCRYFTVQDLIEHPPRLILPVGTTALGALCHKSSAQEWGGKLLTWRGWPDDWLTDGKYNPEGHPIFGPVPTEDKYIPMVPVQAPRLVYYTQNQYDIVRWRKHIRRALELAVNGVGAMNYDRPWFKLSEDPDEIIRVLNAIPDGTRVTYDTETTGLFPFLAGAKVVFMMFRWVQDGTPMAIAFPWDFAESPLLAHLARLRPVVLATMYRIKLTGHNLGFDVIYTFATNEGCNLEKLTASMDGDTRHMIYAYRQSNESLGLERVAYDWCPDMAGYEENFELLKQLLPDLLDPGAGQGGHYAKCPRDKWSTHLRPYVFGDVEVAAIADENLQAKLKTTKTYQIPLANPDKLGSFCKYTPIGRHLTYRKIMLPSQRVLTRMMARGMHVDRAELANQEDLFPKLIKEARSKLRVIDERVIAWADQQEATIQDWKLDLEDRSQLKSILFEVLNLPVKRLTPVGQRIFGEDADMNTVPRAEAIANAAIDKFTLNGLVAEFPALAPLQEYKKLYKAYTTYVRSMRNITTEGIDKKDRKKEAYLMADGRVHAIFNQCGTRSGRLSSSSPNLQQLPSGTIVKRMYASRFGLRGCIYQSDLSQIELRLLAAACGDPLMVKAYRDNIDLHSLTTSKIFKVPYESFEKTYMAELQKTGRDKEAKDLDKKRKIGKTVNFLTGYGGGAYGLQTTLAEAGVYLTLEECERIVEALFDTYPSLRTHIGLYKTFISNHGCAVSLTGRVRVFDEVFSDDNGIRNKALRSGYNHLIQSSASDMMGISMVAIEHIMRAENLESVLVSTVHDSLVIDAVQEELPRIHEICLGVLNNMPEVLETILGPTFDSSWLHVVPLAADSEVGANYCDAFKLSDQPDWDEVCKKLRKAA